MKKALLCAVLSTVLSFAVLSACGKEIEAAKKALPAAPESVLPEESAPPLAELPQTGAPVSPQIDPPQAPEEETPRERYLLVKTDGLNVRAGAGVGTAVLGQWEKGVLVAYAGTVGNWYETLYRGKTAYISAKEDYSAVVEAERGTELAERVIEEGEKLLGTPYVYGAVRLHDGRGHTYDGFTTDAFDCSSLMQYIFYRGAGVLLDVNTRTQIKQGERVSADGLRRGDLMFFTNDARRNRTGIERVGHVGLYLGGNYLLHTASDYAKIEQISEKRWSYFIEGRRVL